MEQTWPVPFNREALLLNLVRDESSFADAAEARRCATHANKLAKRYASMAEGLEHTSGPREEARSRVRRAPRPVPDEAVTFRLGDLDDVRTCVLPQAPEHGRLVLQHAEQDELPEEEYMSLMRAHALAWPRRRGGSRANSEAVALAHCRAIMQGFDVAEIPELLARTPRFVQYDKRHREITSQMLQELGRPPLEGVSAVDLSEAPTRYPRLMTAAELARPGFLLYLPNYRWLGSVQMEKRTAESHETTTRASAAGLARRRGWVDLGERRLAVAEAEV